MAEKKVDTEAYRKQKRVLVAVSPSMYELVNALGKEANVATSLLLGEMIEEARPAFEAMLEAVKQAKANQADAYDTLHRTLLLVQQESADLQLDLLDHKAGKPVKRLSRRRKDVKDDE